MADPIPDDIAAAFADAVLAYDAWLIGGGVTRKIDFHGKWFSIETVCDLAGFEDKLPDMVFEKLRSFIHDVPDKELIVRIEASPSYASGAWCLKKLTLR
jgi:hypothetical protein